LKGIGKYTICDLFVNQDCAEIKVSCCGILQEADPCAGRTDNDGRHRSRDSNFRMTLGNAE
ncbi:MAG: hypothetical protein ACK2U6_09815, partial [Candidatus Promineifilaceae bacterium]